MLASTAAAPQGSLAGHPGVELQYRGTLTQLARGGDATEVKQFDLFVYILAKVPSKFINRNIIAPFVLLCNT